MSNANRIKREVIKALITVGTFSTRIPSFAIGARGKLAKFKFSCLLFISFRTGDEFQSDMANFVAPGVYIDSSYGLHYPPGKNEPPSHKWFVFHKKIFNLCYLTLKTSTTSIKHLRANGLISQTYLIDWCFEIATISCHFAKKSKQYS